MSDIDEYLYFQFAVDNAACLERAIALLMAQRPIQPGWIHAYLGALPANSPLQYYFLQEYLTVISIPPTATDLHLLSSVLKATGIIPDRWLLKAACDTGCKAILDTMLEVDCVVVDDWICYYACNCGCDCKLLDALIQKREGQ